MWVDRSGREFDKMVSVDNSVLGPALSHDGRRVAVYRFANGHMDIWSYDTIRRAWDRITVDPGDDIFPLWSRDGASVVFAPIRGDDTTVNRCRPPHRELGRRPVETLTDRPAVTRPARDHRPAAANASRWFQLATIGLTMTLPLPGNDLQAPASAADR